MAEVVVLHIYDVANTGSKKTNKTIIKVNRFFKDWFGLGGVFDIPQGHSGWVNRFAHAGKTTLEVDSNIKQAKSELVLASLQVLPQI